MQNEISSKLAIFFSFFWGGGVYCIITRAIVLKNFFRNFTFVVFDDFKIIFFFFLLFRIATETSPKITADSSFWSNYGNVIGWNDNATGDFGITVKNLLVLKTTPLSFRTLKKAEAVTAKDSISLEKEYNSHLGFFILTSIGLVVMAALTFTSVYFSRARRDQSYQRQNQDIEVCSISSIGNELW